MIDYDEYVKYVKSVLPTFKSLQLSRILIHNPNILDFLESIDQEEAPSGEELTWWVDNENYEDFITLTDGLSMNHRFDVCLSFLNSSYHYDAGVILATKLTGSYLVDILGIDISLAKYEVIANNINMLDRDDIIKCLSKYPDLCSHFDGMHICSSDWADILTKAGTTDDASALAEYCPWPIFQQSEIVYVLDKYPHLYNYVNLDRLGDVAYTDVIISMVSQRFRTSVTPNWIRWDRITKKNVSILIVSSKKYYDEYNAYMLKLAVGDSNDIATLRGKHWNGCQTIDLIKTKVDKV